MKRIQTDKIIGDLKKKLVFLVGPRQVGKTWLAKEISKGYKNPLYLSYDLETDRKIIKETLWPVGTDLIIFDEIHKMRGWKNYLKGVYDTKEERLHILVTGSSRLDAYKNAGDSLAGRYRVHHLLPISYKELDYAGLLTENSVNFLIERGGFPEPFLAETNKDRDIWRNLYSESLIKEDVIDFKDIDNFKAIKNVFELLKTKVGSPISYKSISEDVGISPKTVKNYISILESLYIIFLIRPFSKKIGRSILKEPKIYFYDTGLVKSEDGVRFENMIAVSLLKHAHAVTDETGKNMILATLRNKQKNEVDFVLVENDEVFQMIEVKLKDDVISAGLKYFKERNNFKGVQVVRDLRHNKNTPYDIEIMRAQDYLKNLLV